VVLKVTKKIPIDFPRSVPILVPVLGFSKYGGSVSVLILFGEGQFGFHIFLGLKFA
jgi:hypothetical protein